MVATVVVGQVSAFGAGSSGKVCASLEQFAKLGKTKYC